MPRKLIILISCLGCTQVTYSLPNGSPVCNVFADYSNVTGMQTRTRNLNPGSYIMTANISEYNSFEHVEITISGPPFLGLMFTVVDSNGDKVGLFSPDTQVQVCEGKAMSVTHSQNLSLTTKTLFWIPPEVPVGSVFVEGYILEGAQGTGAEQNFYRFVSDDLSALEITQSEVVFRNGFE